MKVRVVSNEMRRDREPLEVVDNEGRVLVYTREELVSLFPFTPPITSAGAFQVHPGDRRDRWTRQRQSLAARRHQNILDE
jgi:hypothetical protein